MGPGKVGDVVTNSDLGRPLDPIPVRVSPIGFFLASLLWDILDTLPKQRSLDLSIRRSGSIFMALQISQLPTLSRSVTPRTLRKNPISVACT